MVGLEKILLVEDNPISRQMFHQLLDRQFDVVEAESAEEAQARLQEMTPDLE